MTKTEALEKVEFWFADKVDDKFYGKLEITSRPGHVEPQVMLRYEETEQ